MKRFLYILVIISSLVLVSCFNTTEPSDARTYLNLCSSNIDGSDLQITGAEYDSSYFIKSEFTPDGTKLTNGKTYMNLDGSGYDWISNYSQYKSDYCFNSDGSDYFCVVSSSKVIKHNFMAGSDEVLLDSVSVSRICISKDDDLLAVANPNKTYIIDIASHEIIHQFEFISYGQQAFSSNAEELYFKDNIDISIKAVNLNSSEIRILAPHGALDNHNHNRTRFVYSSSNNCELLEINEQAYNYRTLSSSILYEAITSINKSGDKVIYRVSEGIMINYIDGIGEVLLREGVSNSRISPTGDKYLFYQYRR